MRGSVDFGNMSRYGMLSEKTFSRQFGNSSDSAGFDMIGKEMSVTSYDTACSVSAWQTPDTLTAEHTRTDCVEHSVQDAPSPKREHPGRLYCPPTGRQSCRRSAVLCGHTSSGSRHSPLSQSAVSDRISVPGRGTVRRTSGLSGAL